MIVVLLGYVYLMVINSLLEWISTFWHIVSNSSIASSIEDISTFSECGGQIGHDSCETIAILGSFIADKEFHSPSFSKPMS